MDAPERRHFSRIAMDGEVILYCAGHCWPARLVDICLKGALVARPEGWSGRPGQACRVDISLGEGISLRMSGTVMHCTDGVGFRCDHIDLESIAHLRRLIELNLGDNVSLERELTELF